MMADQPEDVSFGRLEPLCSLDLPLNALVGYNDAQHGRPETDNPFAQGSTEWRQWTDGYNLAVKELASSAGFGLWAPEESPLGSS